MNQLWKDHIFLDFKYSSGYTRALLESENFGLLSEEFGQIPGLDDILAQNWKKFNLETLKTGAHQIVPLTAPFIGPNCFLGVKYFPDESPSTTKGVTRFSKNADFKDGKWEGVNIYMSLEKDLSYAEFCRILAHELLHLYDHSKRFGKVGTKKKGSEEEWTQEDVEWRPNYNVIQSYQNSPNTVLRIVGNILYTVFPGERSAFLSQMKQELKVHADSLGTPEGCQKAIENTTYYTYIKVVKRWLRDLATRLKEEDKPVVAQAVSKALGCKKELSFYKAIKRLFWETEKAEKKMQSIAGKLCYDIYSSYILEGFKEKGHPALLIDPKIDTTLKLYE